MLVYGMGEHIHKAPENNWGCEADSDGRVKTDIFATPDLADAWITQEDRDLFELLELGSHHPWVTPQLSSAFNQIMRPGHVSEAGKRKVLEWAEYLVRFVPSYDPSRSAQEYDATGYSRPLLAFYIVTRRADFWSKRLRCYGSPAIDIDALNPDPVLLHFKPIYRWDAAFFEMRQAELQKFETDPNRHLIVQIELLTRVAGIVITPLGDFLEQYDQWEATQK